MSRFSLFLIMTAVFLITPSVQADSAVYKNSVNQDYDVVYKEVLASLEKHRFFVVLEPDVGENLKGFAERWGEDYNQNKLERIRSMVFCNAWYANSVSNADPDMLALCPLHISLIHKKGVTTVLFVRPDYVARRSKAREIAKELTQAVIAAIEEGLVKAKD
ncbi:MAG: DUF302 domain-containing protein [Gammaproteobacteria bacterium]|nr:DUF302 domain-containing protein [Gammaproteobacteria bacterium]